MVLRAKTDAVRLLDGVRGGDSLAIARAITAIENAGPLGTELKLLLREGDARCRTLGVTGPPGAGKSTLISALIDRLLGKHRCIGVLTVDPSSPVSGGAVLGDRVRMASHSRNPNVFIRSLAARGHLGGVTRATRDVIGVLGAAGMDLVIVETVGTGQSEVEVAELTDVRLVVCPPGLGDDMQAIKAGILEIADLLVVNKADLPDAERTAGHLKTMLHYGGDSETRQVLLVSVVTGDGLAALASAIDDRFSAQAHEERPMGAVPTVSPQTLADEAGELVCAFVRQTGNDRIRDICLAIERGEITHRDGAVAAVGMFVVSCGDVCEIGVRSRIKSPGGIG